MGLKPNFTKADIARHFDKVLAEVDKAILFNLSALGEECRNDAIINRGYTDQTGNLVSSIGYVIINHGKVHKSVFETRPGKKPGVKNGEDKGRGFAESMSFNYPTSYALIVVAGMDYAVHVENMGKNVLTSAETHAIKGMPEVRALIKRSLDRISSKIR